MTYTPSGSLIPTALSFYELPRAHYRRDELPRGFPVVAREENVTARLMVRGEHFVARLAEAWLRASRVGRGRSAGCSSYGRQTTPMRPGLRRRVHSPSGEGTCRSSHSNSEGARVDGGRLPTASSRGTRAPAACFRSIYTRSRFSQRARNASTTADRLSTDTPSSPPARSCTSTRCPRRSCGCSRATPRCRSTSGMGCRGSGSHRPV